MSDEKDLLNNSNNTTENHDSTLQENNSVDVTSTKKYSVEEIKTYITNKKDKDVIYSSDMPQEELFTYIKQQIDAGNVFHAYSIAGKFFEDCPDNIKAKEIYALSLLKTGAVEDAKNIVTSFIPYHDVESINTCLFVQNEDHETLAGVAHIFSEIWKFSKDCKDLDVARELYVSSFNKDSGNVDSGINAAWLSWITGEDEIAHQIITKVLDLLPQLGLNATFDQMILLAEAQLILARYDDAIRIYAEAMTKQDQNDYLPVVKARQKLMFLKSAGVKIPDNVLDALTPPRIVVFTGQMIDKPYQEVPIFPNEMEEKVREIIKNNIEELDARIGYSSASAGSEIIFLEEMHKLGREINIILPFEVEDFIEHNVRYAGPRWEKRFEKIIKCAHSVSYSVDDKFLNHSMLYRFSNQIVQGSAVMRGKFLTSDPHLLILWDSLEEGRPGGPSDFMDQWTNIDTLHVIDIDSLSQNNKNRSERKMMAEANVNKVFQDPLTLHLPERSIRCMMFSDFHGYSKLQDEHIPDFLDFMQKLKNAIAEIDLPLESINTWGDAVFAVTKDPIVMADFALLFCDVVTRLGKCYPSFPMPILARISLHSGPVYKAVDPFLGKENFYGGHINRAARLEPVTKVGQVYATQQFVSVLHSEVNKIKNECIQRDLVFVEKFTTEYVGVISLAKNFGSQEVYHIRKL